MPRQDLQEQRVVEPDDANEDEQHSEREEVEPEAVCDRAPEDGDREEHQAHDHDERRVAEGQQVASEQSRHVLAAVLDRDVVEGRGRSGEDGIDAQAQRVRPLGYRDGVHVHAVRRTEPPDEFGTVAVDEPIVGVDVEDGVDALEAERPVGRDEPGDVLRQVMRAGRQGRKVDGRAIRRGPARADRLDQPRVARLRATVEPHGGDGEQEEKEEEERLLAHRTTRPTAPSPAGSPEALPCLGLSRGPCLVVHRTPVRPRAATPRRGADDTPLNWHSRQSLYERARGDAAARAPIGGRGRVGRGRRGGWPTPRFGRAMPTSARPRATRPHGHSRRAPAPSPAADRASARRCAPLPRRRSPCRSTST